MYRLVKAHRKSEDDALAQFDKYFYFIDRRCLDTKKVILAQPDGYTLMFSASTMDEMNTLLKDHDSSIPEWDNGLSEMLEAEMLGRALTYGRIPAAEFIPTWVNLDLGNNGYE